jgi:4-hydroxybenzoate polyprenyltransferase
MMGLEPLQEPLALRIIIAASAAATLLYTPLLKRMTLVKNAAVAAVIALAPVSGALAAGAVRRAPTAHVALWACTLRKTTVHAVVATRSVCAVQDAAVLGAVAAPAAYLFLAIMHREILMDINDTRGDQEAGVRTLPVVYGRRAALGVAAAMCAAATVIAAHAALAGSGLARLVRTYMTAV